MTPAYQRFDALRVQSIRVDDQLILQLQFILSDRIPQINFELLLMARSITEGWVKECVVVFTSGFRLIEGEIGHFKKIVRDCTVFRGESDSNAHTNCDLVIRAN